MRRFEMRMDGETESADTGERAAAVFQEYRARLWGIAYGILASPEDADDLVQEAYMRWHSADRSEVRQSEAWLVTTITRLGIDRLRARQVERSMYVGPWLPTPVVDPAPSPDRAVEVDSERVGERWDPQRLTIVARHCAGGGTVPALPRTSDLARGAV